MIPQVVQALAGGNFTVYVYFLDGAIRLLDALKGLETQAPVLILIPVSYMTAALLPKTRFKRSFES